MDFAAILISALAVIVSILVALKQIQIQTEQQKVQGRLGAIEEARRHEEVREKSQAALRATIKPLDLVRAIVTVTNSGYASAEGLDVLQILPITSGRLPPQVRNPEDFPHPQLRPSDGIDIRLDYARGNTDHSCDLVLTWTDSRGLQTESFRLRHERRH